jgi:hypothetical protein
LPTAAGQGGSAPAGRRPPADDPGAAVRRNGAGRRRQRGETDAVTARTHRAPTRCGARDAPSSPPLPPPGPLRRHTQRGPQICDARGAQLASRCESGRAGGLPAGIFPRAGAPASRRFRHPGEMARAIATCDPRRQYDLSFLRRRRLRAALLG